MRTIAHSIILAAALSPVVAFAGTGAGAWSHTMLYNPSASQLEAEARGLVMIYDGFTDRDVEAVLDDQFDRVQAMMFTRTVVTTANGKPARDPRTGNTLTENDGCD